GTGSVDEEMPVINTGYGFSLAKDSNAEVLSFYIGSDTNQKFALPTIPHDKQRQWGEGHGGVQSPTDPERYLEFNSKRTHLKDGAYAFGATGGLEISGNTVTIRGNLVVEGSLTAGGGIGAGGTINTPGEMR